MAPQWDIVIVGCGPVGAFAANLFGQLGLKTLIIDRDETPYALPRAVHIDHEMVRLLAGVGLAGAMLPKMRAGDGHMHIGADSGVIRYLSVPGSPRPYGYSNDYFFFQPELEAALRAGLDRYSHVSTRLGTAATSVEQNDDGATVTVASGEVISTRWVIGCDGARSTVRRAAGIDLDDLDFDEPWLVVDAEVEGDIAFPELQGVPAGANLQRLSVMMCDPERPATIVPGRGNHRRWEFMLLPGEDDRSMAAADVVANLIAPWVRGTTHRVMRAATYRFHGLVAKHWRRGRIFLAGDSAHQTPPFFGQGMCHGLRDAANLAWKLALVTRGEVGADLLDTYQAEREGQVRHVIGAAVEAGRYICELDPEKAAERDRNVRSQGGIRSASELIAPIRSAIVSDGAGERFINPEIGGGLFDDVSGGGWVLLETAAHELSAGASSVLDTLGAARLTLGGSLSDAHAVLADWFKTRGLTAALVRPDFYVTLVADSDTALDCGLTALAGSMGLRSPQTMDIACAT